MDRFHLFYDKYGHPISETAWAALHRDENYLRIGYDTVGRYRISTVWMGIDHGFGLSPVPVIFETMIFPDCDYCERYATVEAALAGHDRAVALARDRHAGGQDWLKGAMTWRP